MYRIAFLLFAALFYFPLHAQDPDFRIMSYNIRFANPGDGVHDWDHRRPLVKSLIRFHHADIIGVQEALRTQLDDLTADMPEYAWYGVSRSDGTTTPKPDSEFSAILYRADRFEILDGQTFWLSPTPETPGSKGWDAALPRIVTWVKFFDRNTDKIFFHFNTHFDHMGVEARTQSAFLLLKKVSAIAGDLPIVLTGDFNCPPTDKPYNILTARAAMYHLYDAQVLSQQPHHGPLSSFAGNFEVSGLIGDRIDFIFTRGHIAVLRHAILSDNWNGSFASDHLPVLAEIEIRE